jgi:hypothetical protein
MITHSGIIVGAVTYVYSLGSIYLVEFTHVYCVFT